MEAAIIKELDEAAGRGVHPDEMPDLLRLIRDAARTLTTKFAGKEDAGAIVIRAVPVETTNTDGDPIKVGVRIKMRWFDGRMYDHRFRLVRASLGGAAMTRDTQGHSVFKEFPEWDAAIELEVEVLRGLSLREIQKALTEKMDVVRFIWHHEMAHAQRMTSKSINAPATLKPYGGKRAKSSPLPGRPGYGQLPAEWDANISAMIATYNQLGPRQKKWITVSKLLKKSGIPEMETKDYSEDPEWRKKVMSRLAREGVVIRKWE